MIDSLSVLVMVVVLTAACSISGELMLRACCNSCVHLPRLIPGRTGPLG